MTHQAPHKVQRWVDKLIKYLHLDDDEHNLKLLNQFVRENEQEILERPQIIIVECMFLFKNKVDLLLKSYGSKYGEKNLFDLLTKREKKMSVDIEKPILTLEVLLYMHYYAVKRIWPSMACTDIRAASHAFKYITLKMESVKTYEHALELIIDCGIECGGGNLHNMDDLVPIHELHNHQRWKGMIRKIQG